MNATHLTRCKSLASALNSTSTPITEWMAAATEAGLLLRELGEQEGEPIPTVARATGRTIPDLTKREHVCEWQSPIKALAASQQEPLTGRDATIKLMAEFQHDLLVGMQAALIEWRHGKGAEAALEWIENGLDGPGLIPSPDEPYGKEAQAYFDANRANPFPQCFCGRPSNQLWMGRGFCSQAHYLEAKAAAIAKGAP